MSNKVVDFSGQSKDFWIYLVLMI